MPIGDPTLYSKENTIKGGELRAGSEFKQRNDLSRENRVMLYFQTTVNPTQYKLQYRNHESNG